MSRAAYLTSVVLITLVVAVGFIPVAYYLGWPYAIGTVLTVPVMLSGAGIQRRDEISPGVCALILGTPGLMAVAFAFMAQVLVMRFSPILLPAGLEIALAVLAWLGVAILAISDLLFVVVVSGALLARLRTSA